MLRDFQATYLDIQACKERKLQDVSRCIGQARTNHYNIEGTKQGNPIASHYYCSVLSLPSYVLRQSLPCTRNIICSELTFRTFVPLKVFEWITEDVENLLLDRGRNTLGGAWSRVTRDLSKSVAKADPKASHEAVLVSLSVVNSQRRWDKIPGRWCCSCCGRLGICLCPPYWPAQIGISHQP